MLFIGDDWAEAHHDIELVRTAQGRVLARRRLPEGSRRDRRPCMAWSRDHLGDDDEPDQVLVGIETDRGPWVQALIAAGYTGVGDQPAPGRPLSGTARHLAVRKSDPGDAHVLAEIVRLDRVASPAGGR